MKKRKNNLDEMQEKKLLKIEHNGFWIAFWGLFAAIYFQIAIGNGGFKALGGESIILLIMSVYLMIGCIKSGIWDRKLKPNLKTNVIVSLIAGLSFGAFWFAVSYHNYHALAGSLAAFAIMFIGIGGGVFILLSLGCAAYKHRKNKLDEQADNDENAD